MLKRTAIYEEHVRAGGRIVEFGGWEMPVQYTGLLDEHLACRAAAGLFDVSHMGEVHAEGRDAEGFVNHLVANNVAKLSVEQALYTPMCNDEGGIVDDLLVYRRAPDRFLLVINASNTDKDFAWMQKILARERARFSDVRLTNESPSYSQIAVQGRNAAKILQPLVNADLSAIKYYWFKEGTVLGNVPAIISQTGYTGEYGFEVYLPWHKGADLWRALMDAGKPHGLKPCGLGARDTLRFEMRFPLYGHELLDNTNPLEAGIEWTVKLAKGDFVGRTPTASLKERGLARKLVGLKVTGRGIPRPGYPLYSPDGAMRLGEITSGTHSPSLNLPLGIGYVTLPHAADGARVLIEIRGTKIPAEIIPTPFYKRPY
ncbi:MAG: glycine cleavage system protein T [Bdellovibrionales bacterium RIFOXYD1_FULL_53_11]|nr:MAG: glycine cleavage system protein T [Bdellovibrionales bacterium RIFOXYD1_FULL_53_11]